MNSVIEVRNVTKRYGVNEVLKDVSLTCEAGKIYGLVGRNGSGKTVLLKSICGLVHPTSGEVYVWGQQVGKDIDFPEDIGFIIESPGFLSQESGLRNLKHLASIGHRRIALLCAPHRYHYIRERHEGYLQGLRDAGLQADSRLIDCSEDSGQGVAAMLALPEKERPSAVFALADSLAVKAEYLAIRLGFRVPEDLSVFGFGNTEACGTAFVPLSSVEESPYDCGELAVKIILDKPADVCRREDGRYLIAPLLVHRDSTGPCGHGHRNNRNIK